MGTTTATEAGNESDGRSFRIGRSVPPRPGHFTIVFEPPFRELRIPVIADASMPSNCFELRSGNQRLRVRWPDKATELDRWADDGGRAP